jgi:hypothetical protein
MHKVGQKEEINLEPQMNKISHNKLKDQTYDSIWCKVVCGSRLAHANLSISHNVMDYNYNDKNLIIVFYYGTYM